VIDIRNLDITLGEFNLRQINLRIPEGAYFVILGPTGAGKTVLLECIVGLHQPDAGQIFLNQQEVTLLKPEERRLSYVPQDYCLFPHLTAYENIAFGMRSAKMPAAVIAETVARLAGMLHITALLRRRPLTLSGGEKQRVALARALAVRPRVLLLDEPMAAVDERTREEMCEELKALQREFGTTTIHVSHNFEETLAVADLIGIFQDGRIVQVGDPRTVFHQPVSEFVADFTGARNILRGEVKAAGNGAVFHLDDLRLRVDGACPGPATLVVRPESIRLLADAASDENRLCGAVVRMVDKGPTYKIDVATGAVSWVLLASKREAADLALAPGRPVTLDIPPSAIHLIPAEDQALPPSPILLESVMP